MRSWGETVGEVPGGCLEVADAVTLKVTSQKGRKIKLISQSEKHEVFSLRDVI